MDCSLSTSKAAGKCDGKASKALLTLPLFSKMPRKAIQKERKRTFKYVFDKIRLRKCASATISKPFPTYHVAYLGNVVTGWAKGEGCIEKPLATLWRNYIQSSRPDVNMHLTVCGGGLKAVTKNHGLTEYWAHRLTTCASPAEFPRIFCWVYRHEGRRLRHELRCHAVLCASTEVAAQIHGELKDYLSRALTDFKKEKLSRQNARLSLVNSINENASLPRRKILLGIGCHNYRPPLECSKSAPKLSCIEETFDEEEDEAEALRSSEKIYRNILKSYERCNQQYDHKPFTLRRRTWRSQSEHAQQAPRAPFNTRIEAAEAADDAEEKNDGLEFKIGGEVLPTIKGADAIPAFVNPIISKGLMEQEQVSLVPVGESHSDFSSLKVYKKRNMPEAGKDFQACTMFLSAETVTQLENIFQAHCSFGSDRAEEDLTGKISSTLVA
ncbi:hypothetical protein HUJ04_005919 [Dendroctonus ponderosae]|uniref:PID domain-containing protein n=1 Tax=Dendroctonus ponderosae TaxID=77166 RepID=A0AAR5NYC5_DENPD|nr:hypothetical protein HUJ04_005919 [Dendroctonus ponderosae]